ERAPPFFKCNVDLCVIHEAGIAHYFFPDRLVLCSRDHVASIAYTDLSARVQPEEVELLHPPADSAVISSRTTWRFQRVDGGPDRRYNNNWSTTYSTCLFGRIVIADTTDVLLEFTASNHKAASSLADAITAMGRLSRPT